MPKLPGSRLIKASTRNVVAYRPPYVRYIAPKNNFSLKCYSKTMQMQTFCKPSVASLLVTNYTVDTGFKIDVSNTRVLLCLNADMSNLPLVLFWFNFTLRGSFTRTNGKNIFFVIACIKYHYPTIVLL